MNDPTAAIRRMQVLSWLATREGGATVTEIVDESTLYGPRDFMGLLHDRDALLAQCRRDLPKAQVVAPAYGLHAWSEGRRPKRWFAVPLGRDT